MKETSSRFFRAEILFPLGLFLGFLVFVIDALSYPPRPRQLPLAVSLITMAFLAVEILRNLLKRPVGASRELEKPGSAAERITPELDPRDVARKVLVSFIWMPVFLGLSWLLGFVVASFIFVAFLSWFFGTRSKLTIFGAALAMALTLYLVFVKFMGVPLPEGVLLRAILK